VIETKTLSLRKQIAEPQSLEERLQESTATINYLERALLNTKLTTSKLNREEESPNFPKPEPMHCSYLNKKRKELGERNMK